MEESIYKNYTSTAVFSSEEEAAAFTAWGDLYFRRRVMPHLPVDKEVAILEIGCGYGRYLVTLAKLGYQNVYGIDISEEQIRYAQQQLRLTNVAQADAIDFLATHTQRYTTILLLDVLEHVELDYAITLLKKAAQALPAGGKIIIQVPNAMAPMSPNYHGDVTHVKLYSTRTMGQLLSMSGFRRFNHFELPPIPHSFKSRIRSLLWKGLLKPAIKGFLLTANGESMGGIYTSNFLTVATKV